nr:TPA_asm: m99.5 sORF 3 [Murid betaherpesvirus 1]DBA07869.1 TPA_asm: m99.5 sORF 3 [Murid betaherpesvirus 1]
MIEKYTHATIAKATMAPNTTCAVFTKKLLPKPSASDMASTMVAKPKISWVRFTTAVR